MEAEFCAYIDSFGGLRAALDPGNSRGIDDYFAAEAKAAMWSAAHLSKKYAGLASQTASGLLKAECIISLSHASGIAHELRLSNLGLLSLPDALGVHLCPWASAINVSHNELERLPQSLGYSRRLRKLICTDNRLKQIERFGPHVAEAAVDRNQLEALPACGEALKILTCSGNKITALPPMPGMQYLWCADNQLTHFDVDSVSTKLAVLDVSRNRLEFIRGQLPYTLKHLNVEHNRLVYIPDVPGGAKVLAIAGNAISRVQVGGCIVKCADTRAGW